MIRNIRTIPAYSRSVGLASLVLIGTVACYNWFVAPHTNYLRAAQRYESTAEDLARKNSVMTAGIAEKKRKLARLQAEFAQARELVFDGAGAKDFFNAIEAAAEKAGCAVLSLTFPSTDKKPDSRRRGGFLRGEHAKLSVLGDYGGIIALMDEFQNRRERVVIDSISIESTGNPGAPERRLDCRMNVTVYIMQDEEASIHE
jgi:hypothetical protein